MTKTEVHV